MKAERGNAARAYREQVSYDRAANDPYRDTNKPPEPTCCPECHASFQGGRWSWNKGPEECYEQLCPACQRIQDRFPAGYLTISGPFATEHRDEILGLLNNHAEHEKSEHPIQRIMAIEDVSSGLQVTTTDSHLARGLAEKLQDAYDGVLKLRYSRDENLLRASWKR